MDFYLAITEDQADTIKFEWNTWSGKEGNHKLTVNSYTKPFLKFILTDGIRMEESIDWDRNDKDEIKTMYINGLKLTPPTVIPAEKPVVKSVEPIKTKKSTPRPTKQSSEWTVTLKQVA